MLGSVVVEGPGPLVAVHTWGQRIPMGSQQEQKGALQECVCVCVRMSVSVAASFLKAFSLVREEPK